ncbi:MAG: hypothetical protein ACK6CT_14080 [Planctomycetia bacterium]|jgi:hypothetical protein
MKLRSFILVCCMVIVPGLAMFSHHLPDVRWPTAGAAAGPNAAVPADGRSSGGSQIATSQAATATDAGERGTTVQPAVSPPPPAGAADAAVRAAHDRLLSLGAKGIECQPAPAAGGLVLGSCRVAVDVSGQLHRLFQAEAADAAAALQALADDVAAWRQRTAMR